MRYGHRSQKPAVEEEVPNQIAMDASARAMMEAAAQQHRQAAQRLAELALAVRDARRRRDADLMAVANARRARDLALAHRNRVLGLLQRVGQVVVPVMDGPASSVGRVRHQRDVERAALQADRERLEQAVQYRTNLLRLSEATRGIAPASASRGNQREAARKTHANALAVKQEGETLLNRSRQLVAFLRRMLAQVGAVAVPSRTDPARTVDLQSLRRQRDEEQRQLQHAQRKTNALSSQTSVLRQVATGAAAMGMGNYLARASPEAKAVVQECYREACEAGAARAGRRAEPAMDPAAEEKRRRKAERERERRRAAKAALAELPADARERKEVERKTKHRDDRRERRQVEARAPDPVLDGSRPRHRQHEERIEKAAPDKKALMTARLLTARERGHAAAVRDAAARGRHVEGTWQNAHPPLALPDGCKLIAVRGDPGDPDDTMAAILEPGGLERWLREPAEERAKRMNGRARLVYTAGHITAAWSDILKDMARHGTSLEEAAAYRVDEAIARLDLAGHRVAAYWHTDSATGHPHLHIVWARVRDADLSLWSLESRSRATALWLHARSNTVMASGPAALRDDVDALAGFGDAAVDAEVMMANDDIVAHRRLIDGTDLEISLQGDAAAGRVARVGAGPAFLAGGVWRFGLGPDPDLYRAWKKSLAAAKRTGDMKQIDAVLEKRPPNRGYWLPLRGETKGLQDVLASWGFGGYLSKQH